MSVDRSVLLLNHLTPQQAPREQCLYDYLSLLRPTFRQTECRQPFSITLLGALPLMRVAILMKLLLNSKQLRFKLFHVLNRELGFFRSA